MTYKQVLTSKKSLPCVIVFDNENPVVAIIKKTDGSYVFHKQTAYYEPANKSLLDFEPALFIAAWQRHLAEQEHNRQEKEKAEKQQEQIRIDNLIAQIEESKSVIELMALFNLSRVDDATFYVNDKYDLELIELVKKVHGVGGEFLAEEKRAGIRKASYKWVIGLNHFQENIKGYYSQSNNYVYKSRETELERTIEQISEAINSDDEDGLKFDKIKELIEEHEQIEAGYYSCAGGDLVISESELNNPWLVSHTEDVNTVSLCYRFNRESFLKEDE